MAVFSAVTTTLALLIVVHSGLGKRSARRDVSECERNSDCRKDRVCTDQKCIDPCASNVCGKNTLCHVSDHTPLCACQVDHIGHPFSGCFPTPAGWVAGCKQAPDRPLKNNTEKTFHLYPSKMTWYQALAHCSSLGMRLATITSHEEHQDLVDFIKKSDFKHSRNWWIGGSDLGETGNYVWMSSGTTVTYKNYFLNQPDNYAYFNGDKEHCLELRMEYGYMWNDFICNYHSDHVCEELV